MTYTNEQWEELGFWLTGDPTFLRKVERHKKELKDKIVGKRDDIDNRNKARRIAPPVGGGSSSSAARPHHRNRPPRRPRQEGGGSEG